MHWILGNTHSAPILNTLSGGQGSALPDVSDGLQARAAPHSHVPWTVGLSYSGPNGNTAANRSKSARGWRRAGAVSPARRPVRLRRTGADGAGTSISATRWSTARATSAAATATALQPCDCWTEARLSRSPACCSTKSIWARWTLCPTTTAALRSPSQLPARLPFYAAQWRQRHRRGSGNGNPEPQSGGGGSGLRGLIPQLPEEELLALIPAPTIRAAARSFSSSSDIADASTARAVAVLKGACALEDRRAGTRPVATGGDRAAARRRPQKVLRKRSRTSPIPKGQDRQEGAEPGQTQLKASTCWRCSDWRARRVQQGCARAHRVRSPRPARFRSGTDHALLAHTSLEVVRAPST